MNCPPANTFIAVKRTVSSPSPSKPTNLVPLPDGRSVARSRRASRRTVGSGCRSDFSTAIGKTGIVPTRDERQQVFHIAGRLSVKPRTIGSALSFAIVCNASMTIA